MHWRRIDLRSLNFKISHNIEVANSADISKPKNRLIMLCIGFPPFIFCNVGTGRLIIQLNPDFSND